MFQADTGLIRLYIRRERTYKWVSTSLFHDGFQQPTFFHPLILHPTLDDAFDMFVFVGNGRQCHVCLFHILGSSSDAAAVLSQIPL